MPSRFDFRDQIHLKILISVLSFFSSLSTSAYVPVFPIEASKKGASAKFIWIVYAAFCLSSLITEFSSGKLIPKIGTKLALTVGIIFKAFSTIALGLLDLSNSASLFVIGSIIVNTIEAFGFGLIGASSFTLLLTNFPSEVTKITSFVETSNTLGDLIAPIFSTFIYAELGYLWIFVICGAMVLFFLPLVSAFVQDSSNNYESLESSDELNVLQYRHLIFRPEIITLYFTITLVGYLIAVPSVGYISVRIENKHSFLLVGASFLVISTVILGPCSSIAFMNNAYFIGIALFCSGIGVAFIMTTVLEIIKSFLREFGESTNTNAIASL
ncbi:MFS-type transporter SLC18B1-like isoform X2 [Dinothrombium tinctorium]|uniref:MFS-type transporter SLC18B1-like isoform X2 n=1 Tax=Dinothrombium tinctorium TaxID=1965070 RepID=A0A3S3P5F8_9ACAR|nr:MFS-type transporter SLC18B1-like isoform X2 [Dinothrombium tinctorium]